MLVIPLLSLNLTYGLHLFRCSCEPLSVLSKVFKPLVYVFFFCSSAFYGLDESYWNGATCFDAYYPAFYMMGCSNFDTLYVWSFHEIDIRDVWDWIVCCPERYRT